jgi:ribose/xylose/arabinose/galactoside ABC-type transport system permease subunit
MSGINSRGIKLLVYTLCGTLCGIAALTLEFRLRFCNVSSTTSLQISSIAAVIIGGASLKGGEGHVYGTFVGSFIIGSLDNLMNLVGVNVYSQDIVKGTVLLCFMCLTSLISSKKGGSAMEQ